MPSSPGSLHIPRATVPPDAYAFVAHSAPINSLVSLLSLRCAEILDDRDGRRERLCVDLSETFSLFWYLFVTIVEFHFEQKRLLPHLGCVVDNADNIAALRPPLPTFQYNLLQQKLMLLNCCVEELRNNNEERGEKGQRRLALVLLRLGGRRGVLRPPPARQGHSELERLVPRRVGRALLAAHHARQGDPDGCRRGEE